MNTYPLILLIKRDYKLYSSLHTTYQGDFLKIHTNVLNHFIIFQRLFNGQQTWLFLPYGQHIIQLALWICRFHIYEFNQRQIKNIFNNKKELRKKRKEKYFLEKIILLLTCTMQFEWWWLCLCRTWSDLVILVIFSPKQPSETTIYTAFSLYWILQVT